MFALAAHSFWLAQRAAPRTTHAPTPTPTLRRARAEDTAAVSRFLQGLSATSRHLRFHGSCNPRSQTLARYLCHVDGVRHQAWLAWAGAGETAVVVGEARFVVGADEGADPADAELAIAVADGWQGRGVADALMRQVLTAAAAAGVRHLYGDVLTGHGRMAAFMRRHGFATDWSAGGDVQRMGRAPSPPRGALASRVARMLSPLVCEPLAGRWQLAFAGRAEARQVQR